MASLPIEPTQASPFIVMNGAAGDFTDIPHAALYNPAAPILMASGSHAAPRHNQRLRRAQILGTIRRLLTERGVEGVTVRGVAQASGHAVQTIYNLVGPRDLAIVEAISEYTCFVGQTALTTSPDRDEVGAVESVVDCWLRSIDAAPDFCRQVCLIYFTPSRALFYHYRDKQAKVAQALLAVQQRGGALRADVDLGEFAQHLVMFASATCLEWADRPFPLDQLRQRMRAGVESLLAGARTPASAHRTEQPRAYA